MEDSTRVSSDEEPRPSDELPAPEETGDAEGDEMANSICLTITNLHDRDSNFHYFESF